MNADRRLDLPYKASARRQAGQHVQDCNECHHHKKEVDAIRELTAPIHKHMDISWPTRPTRYAERHGRLSLVCGGAKARHNSIVPAPPPSSSLPNSTSTHQIRGKSHRTAPSSDRPSHDRSF